MTAQILYMTLGDDPQCLADAEVWIRRFPELVGMPPLELRCDVRGAEGDLRSRLEAIFKQEEICSIAEEVTDEFTVSEEWGIREGLQQVLRPKLVVICREDDPLAMKVREASPGALWGGCIGDLAIIYHHEAAVVWHEMLHLFGAEDCYDEQSPDESAVPTCGNVRCIMQYAPSLERVGDPPFICDANVKRIRNRATNIANKKGS